MAKERRVYQSKPGFISNYTVKRGTEEIENLYAILVNGAFLCGGYVRYMCSPREKPKKAGDVDIYCETPEVFDKMANILDNCLERKAEFPIAVTYKKPTKPKNWDASIPWKHPLEKCPQIQLIKPIRQGKIVAFGSMQEIIENFDFTVIRCGLTSLNTATVDADFEYDEAHLNLRIKNIHCPISSTHRCMKYHKKGYWCPPSETVKLFIDWENRPEDYRWKIIDMLKSSREGKTLSKEDVEQLEALLRID